VGGEGSPRLGWGYRTAIGEALAEQVVDVLEFAPTGRVLDLIADLGTMSFVLARRVRDPGRVIATEVDGSLLDGSQRRFMEAAPEPGVEWLRIEPGVLPLGDGSCDAVVSLLTLGFGDASALLAEARRIAPRAGGIALAVYDAADPPAHEAILVESLGDQGIESGFLGRLMPAGIIEAAGGLGYTSTRIRDVARFDGPNHFWTVMIEERPLQLELDRLAMTTVASVRARVLARLRPFMAADDTIRIPVSTTLLRA
jgi:SAM-dependent methyltransferase